MEKPSSGSESYSVESEQEFKVKKKKKTGMFSGFEMAFSNVRINTTLRFFDVLVNVAESTPRTSRTKVVACLWMSAVCTGRHMPAT